MAKLYFKYGAMGSSKTANLLMTKFNYEEKNKKVLLLKPRVDNRSGEKIIKSRIGLSAEANYIVDQWEDITDYVTDEYDVVIIDESQFLTSEQVEQLKDIATYKNIPIICYGLLTDFKTYLFEGSKRIVELADSLHEIKTICECGSKATINARFSNGKIVTNGKQVNIGANEKYTSMCYKCWKDKIKEQEK